MRRLIFIIPLLFSGILFAQDKKDIKLEDIWKYGTFRSEMVYGLRSMNDGIHYTTMDRDRGGMSINKYSYESGKLVDKVVQSIELLPEGSSDPIKPSSYAFSADENKLLLATETEQIYRHSTREKNFVYDLKSKSLQELDKEGKQRYATFSPSGNKVAFVRGNNLYVKDFTNGELSQLTSDGEQNKIINGATDWVYEEEFAFDKAFFWSPEGDKIAYYRFDESEVKEFNMPKYGGLYPQDYRFKYPKAGEKNAKVEIYIYDLKSGKSVKAKISGYEYIPRIKWTKNNDQLCVFSMNRLQNDLKLHFLDARTGEAKIAYQEKSDTYIEINDYMNFLDDNSFIWLSEKEGYNHIYHINKKGESRQITKGQWEVTDIYGIDQSSGYIYFQAARKSPMQREIYRIKLDGTKMKELSSQTGNNSASFSKGFKFFINYYSNINSPSFISLHKSSGKQIRVLKDNENLKNKLGEYTISHAEFMQVPASGDLKLNAWMIKPKDFDPNKKYPVLMYVYGGPGSQTVMDRWGGSNYMWYQMLAQKGYIVVSVDNRGTGARGYDFRTLTYEQLGKFETEDQIAAAKFLAKQNYVDDSRIGIWGWSYGGYMSSLCLFKGADIFKTAIAVAPVTNWKYYDSIYTERYMGLPSENEGYDDNAPISHVDGLNGNYLLVHGTADDNVHFQNAVELVSALQKADKQFDMMIYPDRNHGIYGGNTRLHLYRMMTNYVKANL